MTDTQRFSRISRLLGEAPLEHLSQSFVVIVGMGARWILCAGGPLPAAEWVASG